MQTLFDYELNRQVVKPSSAASRAKKEDDEFSPLLPNNNAKNQRIIDDQKLKGKLN